MAFNLSEIINKFLPIKRVDDDLRENPFQTPFGQEIVSIEENFWARLNRLGRPQSAYVNGQSYGVVTQSGAGSIEASPGCILYPKTVVFSADQDCVLNIQIGTKLALNNVNKAATDANGTQWLSVFVKAGTPFIKEFDGDLVLYEQGSLACQVTTTVTTKVYTYICGVEVATNA